MKRIFIKILFNLEKRAKSSCFSGKSQRFACIFNGMRVYFDC